MQRSAEEILAIHDVVVRYGFVVDDRDWERMSEVFTEDAVIDFRDQRADPPRGLTPIIGRDEIVRQFRDVLTHPFQHMIVARTIDDVSDREVVVRGKALCPVPGAIIDFEYRDVVVLTDDGWRIKHKSVKRYNTEPAPWTVEAAGVWQARGAIFEGIA